MWLRCSGGSRHARGRVGSRRCGRSACLIGRHSSATPLPMAGASTLAADSWSADATLASTAWGPAKRLVVVLIGVFVVTGGLGRFVSPLRWRLGVAMMGSLANGWTGAVSRLSSDRRWAATGSRVVRQLGGLVTGRLCVGCPWPPECPMAATEWPAAASTLREIAGGWVAMHPILHQGIMHFRRGVPSYSLGGRADAERR